MKNENVYEPMKQFNNQDNHFNQFKPQPQQIINQQVFVKNQTFYCQQTSIQQEKAQTFFQLSFPPQNNNNQLKFKQVGNQQYWLKDKQIGLEGIISEGKNCQTGEIVVIKTYNTMSNIEIELLQQLKLTELQHVIRIKDFIVQQNEQILVMEQGKGGLDELMQEEVFKKMSNQEKNQLFLQILLGVNELNKMGYFHRDLKPQNIIYFEDSKKKISLKLIDFGQIKELGATNSIQKGTMSYMAPEVALMSDNYQYDQKIDIWSLGIIWFEMITGFTMLQVKGDKKFIQTLKSITQNDIDKIIDNNPYIQDFEKGLIKKILVKDPNYRIEILKIIEELINKNHLLEKESELQLLIRESEEKFNQLKNIVQKINHNFPDFESYKQISSKKIEIQIQIEEQIKNLKQLKTYAEKDKELFLQSIKENEQKIGGQMKQELIAKLQSKLNQLEENDKELNSIIKFVNNQYLKNQIYELQNNEIVFQNIKVLNENIEKFQNTINSIKLKLNQTDIMQQIEKTKELNLQIEQSLQINQKLNQFEKIKQDYNQNFSQYKFLLASTIYILLYHLTKIFQRIKHDYSRQKNNQSQIQIIKREQNEQEYMKQYHEAQQLKEIYEKQITKEQCEMPPEEMEDHKKSITMQIDQLEKNIKIKNLVKLRPCIKNQQFIKFIIEPFFESKEFRTMSFFDDILLQGRTHAQTEGHIDLL
ncbi:unnamed protein product [Paramecium primaurelia]|uniref:Protein kinase domain-containing protein n=1 Tax=Paramecium primaurelia TaxID=5886 RepID=A0A8S1NZC2_PARPR|nr:unnamed protein product [Paramecium primaurelia]